MSGADPDPGESVCRSNKKPQTRQ